MPRSRRKRPRPTILPNGSSGGYSYIPASGGKARASHRREQGAGVAEYRALTGRGHSLTIDHGWREVAGVALAFIASFLASIPGPIILVGHSYGGAVITDAAYNNPNVKALVYIDAFVPDEGESILQLASTPPPPGQPASCLGGDPSTVFNSVAYPGGNGDVDLYIKPSLFPSCFANGLPTRLAVSLAASQRPIAYSALTEPSGPPAWKTIPSWYLLGTLDNVIPPYAQQFMAQRAHAQIVDVAAGIYRCSLTLWRQPN